MADDATSRKPIKLALLMCDTPIPTVREQFGTYLDIFRTQLQLSNPNQTFPFTLDGFDVVGAQEYPDLDSDGAEEGYRGILISGSGAVISIYNPKTGTDIDSGCMIILQRTRHTRMFHG